MSSARSFECLPRDAGKQQAGLWFSRLARTALLCTAALSLMTLGVSSLAATSALAATGGGPVYGWGAEATGASGNVLTPQKVALPAGVTATDVAASGDISAAVGSDGLVYLWGAASGGVPGGGPTYPVSVALPAGVRATAVAAGFSFVLALGVDGNVYAWGVDGVGELGTGSPNTDENAPTKVLLPAGQITAIAAGGDQGLALTSAGDAYGWGGDYYGQVGDGADHKPSGISTPTLVDLSGISALSADTNVSMALTSGGEVYAWGLDSNDQIGPNCTPADAFDYCSTPTQVIGGASAIAAGQNAGLALVGGEVFSWGANDVGELGRDIGGQPGSATPGEVPLAVAATAIAEGGAHGAVIGSDGNVYSWGANGQGEVGDGTQSERDLPVLTALPALAAGTVPRTIVASTYETLLATGPAPAVVPGAPTGPVAVARDGAAALSWEAPASDGGEPISGYTVTVTDTTTAASTFDACPDADIDSSTSCVVSGLTNGHSYVFEVAAINAVGTGPVSGPSEPVIPATVPAAPTGVHASPGNRTATLSWTPPASSVGGAITGYTVTWHNSTAHTMHADACSGSDNSTLSSCIVSGLTNGNRYSFQVAAINGIGVGQFSTSSPSVTPATVPSAPRGLSARAGSRSVRLKWTAPARNGGSPITGYVVSVHNVTTGKTLTRTCPSSNTKSTTCTIKRLIDRDKYTFKVAATNALGTGKFTAATSSVTPSH